jgi:RecB family exonuclease
MAEQIELSLEEQERIRVRQGKDPSVYPQTVSRINLYETCPRWYAFEYGVKVGDTEIVERLPRVRGAAAELGDRFHRLAALIGDGAEAEEAAELMSVPLEMWDRWLMLRQKARELAEPEMRNWLAGVEEQIRWRFPLADGREAEVEARIDRIYVFENGLVGIDDYKTGTPWNLPRSTAELRRLPQLRTYALAALITYPDSWQYDCRLIFPESGEVRSVTLDFNDVDSWREALIAKTEEMANDVEFKPKPGMCHLCPYAIEHCPVGKALNGASRPLVDEQAARTAAMYLQYVEGVRKQLQARLKEWAAIEGPVVVGGQSYGPQAKETTGISLEMLPDAIRVMRQAGVPEEEMPVKWDTFDGQRWLEGEEALPELQEMATRVTRRWTGWRKVWAPNGKRSK